MAINLSPYPFPSNIHVSSSVTIKLNDTNYLLWKTQIETLLRSQRLLGFVTGKIPQPSVPSSSAVNSSVPIDSDLDAWICTDELIKSWIYGTLSDEVLGYLHCLPTSQSVWESLANNFNKSSLAREYELRRRLQILVIHGRDYAGYCKEFRAICDSLSSIGKPLEEPMKCFSFMNGLSRDYDPIRTVLQNSLSKSQESQSFNDIMSEITNFDARLQSYEDTPNANPHLAFQVQHSDVIERPRYSSTSYRGRNSFRYNGNRGRGGFTTRGRGFTQQVNSSGWNQSQSSSGTRPICQICGRIRHSALKCYNRFDNAYQSSDLLNALSALRVVDDSGSEWYPDSGASAHVTSSTSHLNNAQPYNGNETIMVGNGEFLPISHVGSTTITTSAGSLPLLDILVCPNIQKSLLSVSKLCEDYPCSVLFDANEVSIVDLCTQKVVLRGPRRNGLYVLEDRDLRAFFSNRQQIVNDLTWHRRLGHANIQILQHLKSTAAIKSNKDSSSLMCEACQMGKSSKLSFVSSNSVVLEPLDRIHCDLWGPSPVVPIKASSIMQFLSMILVALLGCSL